MDLKLLNPEIRCKLTPKGLADQLPSLLMLNVHVFLQARYNQGNIARYVSLSKVESMNEMSGCRLPRKWRNRSLE